MSILYIYIYIHIYIYTYIYIRKSKGPKTEPCGTLVSLKSSYSINVTCILFFRFNLNQSRVIPISPNN